MKINRDIINKKLIPEIGKTFGKATMSYRLGGSLATSYNNSDIYNFERKDDGDIIVADPQRSYLTTTLYPISSKDAILSAPTDKVTGRFTDNLYAALGDAENYSIIRPALLSGLFKVALKEYNMVRFQTDYDENSFTIKAKTLTGVLRDVLKKYSDGKTENILVKANKFDMSMRSVLIKYEYYAAETVIVSPTILRVDRSITLDGSFESYIPFDAIDRVVSVEVPSHSEIDDKASVTWSKTGSPIVQNSVSKEGDYSLYLDGQGTSIKSQESLEYSPTESESLIIENWLKPDTLTTSLLTRYGGTYSERGFFYDYAQNTVWTGSNANTDATGADYLFNTSSHFLSSSNATALKFDTAASKPNGQTLEMNVKLSCSSTTVPLVLLSNQSATWLQATNGNSAALVYYPSNYSNSSYAGKIAVITDNTTNTSAANGIFLISTTTFADNSTINIAVVTYGNYIRLFVNGKLESYAVLTTALNFSYNGSFIGKATWSTTPASFSYRLYALRFTDFGLYTADYIPSGIYSPRAIPKIKSLEENPTYPEGIACGVRYLPNTSTKAGDKTIMYASLSDGENTYIAESTPIDPLKWNHVKLSIYRNTIVLYINGIAYSSEIIPFDIELETISLGSTTATSTGSSFAGYIDNFKMYKDSTFDLEGVKYLELRPYINGSTNITLDDFNPSVNWSYINNPNIVSNGLANNITGYVFNCSSNPKLSTTNIDIDTQNFGIRTYVIPTASEVSTILKIGSISITVDNLTLKATTNGTVFVTTPVLINTLYKVDVRYNRGTIQLFMNDVSTGEPLETSLNSGTTLYYGWDGATSLFTGYLGPVSIFDNNRNRIPAIDMAVDDFVEELYYKNTVLSLNARDNIYETSKRQIFDNGYSNVLNDVINVGPVINSTIENGFYFKQGSYLKVNSNSNFIFGTEDFTIEFTVKTSVTERRQVIVDRYFQGSGSWQTSINTDGNLYFTITNSNTSPFYYFLTTTNQTLNDGELHKVFVRRKGLELSVYVDNKLSDKFGMNEVFDFGAAKDLYIGYQGNNNNASFNFEGYLNNIRITKGTLQEDISTGPVAEESTATVLTAGTVSLRTFDTVVDSDTVTENTWTNSGTSISNGIVCNSPGSLYIPEGSYQTLLNNTSLNLSKTTDFCIEMSFFLEGLTNDYQVLVSKGSMAGNQLSYNVCLTTLCDSLVFIAYSNGSGGTSSRMTVPYKFQLNRWYDIAICNKNSEVFFIIDGIKYIPDTQWGTVNMISVSSNVNIGKLDAATYESYFRGYIDSFKITKGYSNYSRNFGEDSLYLQDSIRLTNRPEADTDAITSVRSTGLTDTTYVTNAVMSSVTTTDILSVTSGYLGSSGYIQDSTGSIFNFGEDSFAIHMKAKLVNTTVKRYLIQMPELQDKPYMKCYIDIDGKLYVNIAVNGEDIKSLVTSAIIPYDKWVTIGIVRTDLKVLRVYINGVVVATLNGVTENFETIGSNCYIGSSSETSMNAYLSYVNVYKQKGVIPKSGDNIFDLAFGTDVLRGNYLIDSNNYRVIHNLTNVTADYGIDGKYTASAFFNGLTGYISGPSTPELNFGDEDFDIEFEIFPTDGGNNFQTIISSKGSVPLKLWMYGSNYNEAFNNTIGFGTDVNNPIIQSTTKMYFDKWTYIRLTRDGSTLRLYIDNVLDKTVILTSHTFNMNTGSGYYLGCANTLDQSTFFKGYLSYFRIARGDIVRVINTDKYKVISALDFENNNTDLVIYDYNVNTERFDRFRHTWSILKYSAGTDDPILRTITSSNEAAYLAGRQGFIYKNKNTHISFKPFTMEIKFMLTNSSTSSWRRLIDQSGLYAINITTDRRIEFNGGSVVLQSPASSISTNKWYHVAVTRDANMVTRLFLDGIKVGESSLQQNYSEANHYPLCIGMYYSYYNNSNYFSNNFEGYVDNFYMINGVCKYTANFVPNIPNDTVLANTSLAYVSTGSFKDTNTSVTWSASNMTVSTTKVKNKASAMFSNSTSGYLQSSYLDKFKPGFNDFTLDFIICPSQIISATTLFDTRADLTSAKGLVVTQPTGNTGSFSVSVGSSLATSDFDVTLNTGINTVASNTYYHLRITRNLGKIYLFLDGSLRASADYFEDVPSTGVFVLGNRVTKNQGFTGYIEQFRYLDKTSLAGTTFAPFKLELI